MKPDSHSWREHPLLPGYALSRSGVHLTELGHKHGCPEPALGRNEAEELAYWVRPIGYDAALRLRIVGLKALYDQAPA